MNLTPRERLAYERALAEVLPGQTEIPIEEESAAPTGTVPREEPRGQRPAPTA